MKPPKPFKVDSKRANSYSQCIACGNWKASNAIFLHEKTIWNLCHADYDDYWENTDELSSDYKAYV